MLLQQVIRVANENRVRSGFRRKIRRRLMPKIRRLVWRKVDAFILDDPPEAEYFREVKEGAEGANGGPIGVEGGRKKADMEEMVIDGAYFIGKNAYKAGKLLKKTVGNVKKVAKKNET